MLEVLTLAECARHARVSVKTLQREVRAGRLRTIRIRSVIRVLASDFNEYLQGCRTSGLSTEPDRHRIAASGSLARLLRLDTHPFRPRKKASR